MSHDPESIAASIDVNRRYIRALLYRVYCLLLLRVSFGGTAASQRKRRVETKGGRKREQS